MKVSKRLWHHTNIGQVMQLFPGEVGALVQQATPQQLLNLEAYLPLIFWRWYFLESSLDSSIPPYIFLDWRRSVEQWPKKGMFSSWPKVVFDDEKHLTIHVDVDYLAFDQQSLLNPKHHSKLIWEPLHEHHSDQINPTHRPQDQVIEYIFSLLETWRSTNPALKKSWSRTEWHSWWQSLLQNLKPSTDFESDLFLDQIVTRVRHQHPDWNLLSTELEQTPSTDKSIAQLAEHIQFWYDCCRFFLVPASWHTSLVAPVFVDRENFNRDVQDCLNSSTLKPELLYSPFTSLRLTPFGHQLLSHLS